jgi:hypothetical protein
MRRAPAIKVLHITGGYGATYPGSVSEDYGYDWVGKRKNPPGSPYPMVFNKVDQLTSRPANGERAWTYDRLGNLNQIAEPDSVILRDFSYFGSGQPTGRDSTAGPGLGLLLAAPTDKTTKLGYIKGAAHFLADVYRSPFMGRVWALELYHTCHQAVSRALPH